MIAAPAHHQLLIENEKVRVLDTRIPPGDTTGLHTHRWPATFYIVSWSDFIRYDENGNIVVDSRNLPAKPLPGSALWSEPLMPHTLKNVGEQILHEISVELKTTPANI